MGDAFEIREKNNIRNVPGLWWESGSTDLVKVGCKASFPMGHRNIRPPRQKATTNISIVIQMPQTSGRGCRTVDYYKLRWFAQQKMLTNRPAAALVQPWSGARQSADAGCALCSWGGARTVLTGTVKWKDLSHTALSSQQGWEWCQRTDVPAETLSSIPKAHSVHSVKPRNLPQICSCIWKLSTKSNNEDRVFSLIDRKRCCFFLWPSAKRDRAMVTQSQKSQ